MAIQLSVQNLEKRYGASPLFEGLSFGLSDGERTGVIGPNGAGKSTLLKILSGLERPDSGERIARRGLRVQYLPQDDQAAGFPAGASVREALLHALSAQHLEDYEREARVDEAIAAHGFNPEQRVDTLSGGRRKRLAILAQTLGQPDLLLLDEPTNHLDLNGVLWLERLLIDYPGAFLLVSHDRRFLETVCNRVIELNRRYKEGYFSNAGRYSDFVEKREALLEAQEQQEETMRNLVRREIEWLRRGPKARTTKQKARIDRAGELISDLKDLSARNAMDRSAAIDFTGSDRQTKRLVELFHVSKSMGGRKLFGPLNLRLGPEDRLGLLGGNGSGKSTLLKVLAGTLAPDGGTIKRADGLQVVTFDQHRESLDQTIPLRRALAESGDQVIFRGRPIHVTSWAERFLFDKRQLDLPVSRLSGGEQARVLIARLMLRPADLLLLDEPTNDLDIHSLEVLEQSLMDFPGALVLVTHDRYLLDRVSRQILALDGKGNANVYADLGQWESLQEEESPELQTEPEPTPKISAAPAEKPRWTQKDDKELKNVEARLREIERKIDAARAALSDPAIATNATELMERQKTLTAAHTEFDEWVARWEALEMRRPS